MSLRHYFIHTSRSPPCSFRTDVLAGESKATHRVHMRSTHKPEESDMVTRDKLIREYHARRGTFPALLFVYLLIVGTMVTTGLAIS